LGGVQRAQASVEYLLLVSAILVGACLLVRFQTPVRAVATAVVHAVTGHARHPSPTLHRHHPHRPPTRRPHPCLCAARLVSQPASRWPARLWESHRMREGSRSTSASA
jgi:hypothetical protein